MKITLKNLLLVLAALAGVVGFVGAFLTALVFSESGFGFTITKELSFDLVYFGGDITKGTIIPFIGFILLITGAITSVFAAIAKKGFKGFFNFISLILFVAGVVMIFLVQVLFVNTNNLGELGNSYVMGIGPILGIIGGAVSILTSGFALLLKK